MGSRINEVMQVRPDTVQACEYALTGHRSVFALPHIN